MSDKPIFADAVAYLNADDVWADYTSRQSQTAALIRRRPGLQPGRAASEAFRASVKKQRITGGGGESRRRLMLIAA